MNEKEDEVQLEFNFDGFIQLSFSDYFEREGVVVDFAMPESWQKITKISA